MHILLNIFCLSCVAVAVTAKHLRNRDESRELIHDFSCDVSLFVSMPGDAKPPEHALTCQGEADSFMPIDGLPSDFIKNNLDLLTFDEGQEVVTLHAPAISVGLNKKIHVDPAQASRVRLTTRGKPNRGRRELYDTYKPTGNANVLVIRVSTSLDNKSPQLTAAQMSDKVFGTNGDTVNLKSQFEACSYNQKTISVGTGNGVVNGVFDVSVPTTVDVGYSTLINEADKIATATLGVSSLSSVFDNVMYCFPAGAVNFIAAAWYNNHRSMYSDLWCGYPSAQMHEVGHNLNLRHSNEGTEEYGDTVGYMGYSYSNDNTKKCYNTVNSVRLGWYDNRVTHITDANSILSTGWTGKLIGPTDYGASTSDHSVVFRLNNPVRADGRRDIFVGYNRREGFNLDTNDGPDQVTVTKGTGDVTSDTLASSLLAKLSVGGSYTISNYDEAGTDLTVQFDSIGIDASTIDYASVTITLLNTPAPTAVPTTASPTTSPTPSPTNTPTTAAPTAPPTTSSPTESPTPSPTNTPTTAAPTAPPTPAPTYDCSQVTSKGNCPSNGCEWIGHPKKGSCVNVNPPGPTTPTSAPAPSPSTCSSATCGGCSGGGECRAAGCSWNKGSCS